MASNNKKPCVFCNIVAEKSGLVYEDDDYVSFKDLKPATPHHYLVIPKKHIGNPSSLQSSDIELVERLLSVGEQVLKEHDVDLGSARFGFHWPPFNSIEHLHMHAIAPVNEMGFISRLIFKPNSYWFIDATTLIKRLEKPKEPI